MRFPFLRRIRHPFYPALKLAAAAAAKRDTTALYGAFEELSDAAGAGIRVERAIFPIRSAARPFLTERERDALWEMFRVPMYTLLVDGQGSVIAFECEAQNGLHLKDGCAGVLFGRVEPAPCECGRPGPRLMPVVEWEEAPRADLIAGVAS